MNYWISPYGHRDAYDPLYMSIDQRKPLTPIVYKGSRALGLDIKKGDYTVEMDTKEGSFLERLKIQQFNGEVIQIIDVSDMHTGVSLYKSPKPKGYIE